MLVGRRCWVAFLSVAVSFLACAPEGSPISASCSLKPPRFASRAEAATVEGDRSSALQLGFAVRDTSLTLVGFCAESPEFPRVGPQLVVGGRSLEPVGGSLSGGGSVYSFTFIYPPTRPTELEVFHERTRLAVIRFDGVPRDNCSLRAASPFRVIACESIMLLEWRTPFEIPLKKLDYLDVLVGDQASKRSLGFYYEGARRKRGNVVIRFGFMKTHSKEVALTVRGVYLRSGRNALHEPLRTNIRLSGGAERE